MKKILISFLEYDLYTTLRKNIARNASVLDVGCGEDSPLLKLSTIGYLEGFDIIASKKKVKKFDKFTKGNVLQIKKYFKKKSFDVCVALDLIEHVSKSNGLQLLDTLEEIAKKKVIIFTPNGFLPQEADIHNPYQKHISGWTVDDFQKRGYVCYGIRGLKYLRKEYGKVKYKPEIVWQLISLLTEPFCYFNPKLAFQIIAIKQKTITNT